MQKKTNISWFDFIRDVLFGLMQDKKRTLEVILLNCVYFIICAIFLLIMFIFINVLISFDLSRPIISLLGLLVLVSFFAAYLPFKFISAISLFNSSSDNIKDWLLFVKEKFVKFLLGQLFALLIVWGVIFVLEILLFVFVRAVDINRSLTRLLQIVSLVGFVYILVYIFTRCFAFYWINLASSDRSIIDNFKDSWHMTKGNFWPIFLFVFVSFGLKCILMSLIFNIAEFIADLFGKGIINIIVCFLIGALPVGIVDIVISLVIINVLYNLHFEMATEN